MKLLWHAMLIVPFCSGIGKTRKKHEKLCGETLVMMGHFGCILVMRVSWTTKDI
jgi:hypothetical protein